MALSDIGSWASIVGLALTIGTLFLTARVNTKVNDALKSKEDKTYFGNRAKNIIKELKEVKNLAEEDANGVLYSTKQYSKINSAINLIESSWDILLPYDNGLKKKWKVIIWRKKFKTIKEIYNNIHLRKNRDVVAFLNELITFLEKELGNNGW